MPQIISTFPVYLVNRAVAHIFYSLCTSDKQSEIQFKMVVPNCEESCRGLNVIEAVPQALKFLIYRIKLTNRLVESRLIGELNDSPAAYVWTDISINTLKRIKQLGKTIFLEQINCYSGKSKSILDDAYQKLGLKESELSKNVTTIPTEKKIQQENQKIELADFIFCPSPEVKKSFEEIGIPDKKLFLTSYGWSPERFLDRERTKSEDSPFTVLFVGSICVRKGSHLLLRAFVKSGIKGKLILCGQIEPIIAEVCKDMLARQDIVHFPYNPDISLAYKTADIFAFPSLEEGGPLVTYEAMAHGLPVIVSPMGGGAIVREGIDGFIVHPYDEDALIESLRKLAYSPDLRATMGKAALKRAQEFTWDKVAARRNQFILDCLA